MYAGQGQHPYSKSLLTSEGSYGIKGLSHSSRDIDEVSTRDKKLVNTIVTDTREAVAQHQEQEERMEKAKLISQQLMIVIYCCSKFCY